MNGPASHPAQPDPVGYLDQVAVSAAGRSYKQALLTALDLGPGHAVLDVGCGPGTDLATLAAAVSPGGTVTGVDSDPAMIAEAGAGFTIPAVHNIIPAFTDFATAEMILGLYRNTKRAITAGYLTPEAGQQWITRLTTQRFTGACIMFTVLAQA